MEKGTQFQTEPGREQRLNRNVAIKDRNKENNPSKQNYLRKLKKKIISSETLLTGVRSYMYKVIPPLVCFFANRALIAFSGRGSSRNSGPFQGD